MVYTISKIITIYHLYSSCFATWLGANIPIIPSSKMNFYALKMNFF